MLLCFYDPCSSAFKRPVGSGSLHHRLYSLWNRRVRCLDFRQVLVHHHRFRHRVCLRVRSHYRFFRRPCCLGVPTISIPVLTMAPIGGAILQSSANSWQDLLFLAASCALQGRRSFWYRGCSVPRKNFSRCFECGGPLSLEIAHSSNCLKGSRKRVDEYDCHGSPCHFCMDHVGSGCR